MAEFLTIKDLAIRFRVTQQTIYNLMKAGKFPRGIRIGKSYRWSLADIEAFEAKGGNI